MEKFELILDKVNFKKVGKIYCVISIILILLCTASILYIGKEKFSMALNYHTISKKFKREGLSDELKSELNSISDSSKDVLNVIATDKDNNVIYKANSNIIGDSNKFKFSLYEDNKKYLQDSLNNDRIYKVLRDENIILNANYIQGLDKIISDIDKDFYYDRLLIDSMEVNFVKYYIDSNTKDRIFIISNITPIPHLGLVLSICGGILGIIFMIYWIGFALWVYKDANRKHLNAPMWGMLILITNIIGLIIYTMFKHTNKICYQCETLQQHDNIFCSNCGIKLNEICSKCGNIVEKNNNYCTKCGQKIK